jgi:hypothetical protein
LLGGGTENYEEIKYFNTPRARQPVGRALGGNLFGKARRWVNYNNKTKIDSRRKKARANKSRVQFKLGLIKVFNHSPLNFLSGLAHKDVRGNLRAKKTYFKFALPGLTVARGFVNRTEAQFIN